MYKSEKLTNLCEQSSCLIGIALQNSTTKLSVTHEDTVSIVHINFNHPNICFAKCQNGECTARLQNKKRIPKSISIQETQNLCGHIHTLFANFEILIKLFPEYFSSNSQDANEDVFYGNNLPQDILTNDINVEDQLVRTISQEEANHFDIKTESWKFNSRSNHKPKDMTEYELSRYILH